ncbi:MAG: 50S ribosomal protein L25 [Ignavibacteria bacterium]|nr:50S ribosomal protein L25 [Ignavibacteria bacterium]
MKEVTLPVEVRTIRKKKVGKLRREGFIPAIYYLNGEGEIPVSVREKNLLPIINNPDLQLINLEITPGGIRQGIVKEVQRDPITERPLHVDFQGVREDRMLTVEIPIVLTGGTPAGVRMGGILQHILHTVEVSCLPKDIPEHIEVNISELAINHSVHVGQLSFPNIRILTPSEEPIVAVFPPKVEKEPTAVETTEEQKEPEVIAKGKKEEEVSAEPVKGKEQTKK